MECRTRVQSCKLGPGTELSHSVFIGTIKFDCPGYPNITVACEFTHCRTVVILFSRIPLGVQKTLLHGGRVTSCWTSGHQSGPKVIPHTESSLGQQVGEGRLFPLDIEKENVLYLFIYFSRMNSSVEIDPCESLVDYLSSSYVGISSIFFISA